MTAFDGVQPRRSVPGRRSAAERGPALARRCRPARRSSGSIGLSASQRTKSGFCGRTIRHPRAHVGCRRGGPPPGGRGGRAQDGRQRRRRGLSGTSRTCPESFPERIEGPRLAGIMARSGETRQGENRRPTPHDRWHGSGGESGSSRNDPAGAAASDRPEASRVPSSVRAGSVGARRHRRVRRHRFPGMCGGVLVPLPQGRMMIGDRPDVLDPAEGHPDLPLRSPDLVKTEGEVPLSKFLIAEPWIGIDVPFGPPSQVRGHPPVQRTGSVRASVGVYGKIART